MVCLQISLATPINIKHVVLDSLGIWINRLFHIFKPIAWNHTLYNVLGVWLYKVSAREPEVLVFYTFGM